MKELEHAVRNFLQDGTGDFGDLALTVHAYQRGQCPAYAAFCESQPVPRNWREIPPLPLSAFRQMAIRTFPAAETVRTFRTSGTTGEGYGEHHFSSLDLYRAAALGGWHRAGLPRERIFCLVPHPDDAPHSSLSAMAGWLAPRDQFFPGEWARLAAAVNREHAPVVLFGTALAFLDLFESEAAPEFALPTGSVAVETGGYKGSRRDIPKPDLYALFSEKLGLESGSVWNEYGMTELSSQFYTRGLGQAHYGASWVRGQVINPENGQEVAEGETGVLRIFDLANIGSSLAVQTRDLAVRRGEGFELIGRDPAALPRGCSRTADEMLAGGRISRFHSPS